jgi:hypothetical protein
MEVEDEFYAEEAGVEPQSNNQISSQEFIKKELSEDK